MPQENVSVINAFLYHHQNARVDTGNSTLGGESQTPTTIVLNTIVEWFNLSRVRLENGITGLAPRVLLEYAQDRFDRCMVGQS